MCSFVPQYIFYLFKYLREPRLLSRLMETDVHRAFLQPDSELLASVQLPITVCPGGTSGKESTCQSVKHKRLRLNPWVRKIPWERKWKSTPLFLPGKSHRQRSLESYGPWGCKQLDMTECLNTSEHSTAVCNGVFLSTCYGIWHLHDH